MSGAVAPGTVLGGQLWIEREIGRGAFGTVWLAQHRVLGSAVAVKVLHRTDDVTARARFENEARAVAQLDSPHVVRVFDCGVTADNEPFIVMELLRGEDLATRLARVGRLSPWETATVITQACRGIGAAHGRGLVHRDVKPANLFLLEVEGDLFVKVLDFGVAKGMGPSDHSMTATGTLVGTPYYMSPEQIIDPRGADHRADLWSLAVVAYACLGGHVPFDGETIGGLMIAIHTGVFAPLSAQRSDLPPSVDAFFARALDVEPSRRFGSARELAQALDEALRGSPSVTHSSAAGSMAHSPAVEGTAPKRSRKGWVIGGLAALVTAGALGAWSFSTATTAAERTPERASGPRERTKPAAEEPAPLPSSEAATGTVVSSTPPPSPWSRLAAPPKASATPTPDEPPAPEPPAPPPPTTSPSTGALNGIVINCWKNNEGANPGTPATSASVNVFVGPPRSVAVSGAGAYAGFRACVVAHAGSAPLTPGEDGYVRVTTSLPAGPPP